jgi:glycosyltransferase involved in cell wall biosynthesis
MWSSSKKRLVVIPNDPIDLYERSGFGWFLENYFNPRKMFHEVFAISPFEKQERQAFGMTILPAPEKDFHSILRDLPPAIVRAYAGHWPAELACRYRVPNVPVVVSVHDTHPDMVKKAVRYADLILCVSAAVEREVLARGAHPRQIRRLPNRVDSRVFHPIADGDFVQTIARQFPPGRYILHVGRKSPQKNLDTVLRALSCLPAEYHCIFVGMGNRAPFLALADQLGIDQRCFWIDAIANDQLPLWFSWCSCMCTPSRWEGFGIVFIEAAACGAAIVTSAIAPMTEFLTHDVNALLVERFEDPHSIANAIRKVCEDAPYRKTICAGAVKAAEPFERAVIDTLEASLYHEAMRMGPYPFSIFDRLDAYVWRHAGKYTDLRRRLHLRKMDGPGSTTAKNAPG